MPLPDLPLALTFDLDPDVFDESVASSEQRTRLSWKGIHEGIPTIKAALHNSLAPHGLRPHPTWFVRVDNQIRDIYGQSAYLLETYKDLFEQVRAEGDEIAWHPHLYRQIGQGWQQETDEARLLAAMEEALSAMIAQGFPPQCARIGEAYGSSGLMRNFDKLGIKVDSTAMAGRKRIDDQRMIDWEPTPKTAYRPSLADHRVPGSPHHDVLELPMSMLRVKADYDQEPYWRYLDLSFHPRALNHGLKDLITTAPYLVTITHPSAFLPEFQPEGGHGMVSFDIRALHENLTEIIKLAEAAGRQIRCVTLAQLADEIIRDDTIL